MQHRWVSGDVVFCRMVYFGSFSAFHSRFFLFCFQTQVQAAEKKKSSVQVGLRFAMIDDSTSKSSDNIHLKTHH